MITTISAVKIACNGISAWFLLWQIVVRMPWPKKNGTDIAIILNSLPTSCELKIVSGFHPYSNLTMS